MATKLRIDKSDLLSIPEVERTFFLALGHASNEINALTKMLYWSAGTPAGTVAEYHGRYSSMILFIRLLVKTLCESWEVFDQYFFGKAFSRYYESRLPNKPSVALENLKDYFSSINSVMTIQKYHDFNYSPFEVDANLPVVEDELVLYFERDVVLNNLYFLSELISGNALFTTLAEQNLKHTFDSLAKELFQVSSWFSQAAAGIMKLILRRYASGEQSDFSEEIKISQHREFDEVVIPWFTDFSLVNSTTNTNHPFNNNNPGTQIYHRMDEARESVFLSSRELQCLELIRQGHRNQDIAKELGLGAGTIRNYLSSIYSKLKVRNRTEAIQKSIDMGIISETTVDTQLIDQLIAISSKDIAKKRVGLTNTEVEVLSMLQSGLMNVEISAQLGIKDGTVRNYTSSIYKKLDVGSRSEAVNKAKKLGLLD